MLDAQLQALAAAGEATGADLWVMAPMVGTAEEAEWFTRRAREAGIDTAGIDTAGIMVEVPAAAIRARHLYEYADFTSIGTNDLTQYTMAADRMNGSLSDLLSAWQPAVIELVRATCEASDGKPVGVCGESAGDPLLALVYVGLGVNSLSMAVGKVPAVRAALALHDLATCEAMAKAALAAPTATGAREAVVNMADPRMRVIT